jgi:hypothetical protein
MGKCNNMFQLNGMKMGATGVSAFSPFAFCP